MFITPGVLLLFAVVERPWIELGDIALKAPRVGISNKEFGKYADKNDKLTVQKK